MKCPNCGKPGKGVCPDCYLANNQPKLKKVEIPTCTCGRMRVGGEWKKDPWKKISELVGRNVILPEKIKPEKISVKTKDDEKHIEAEIKVEGSYEGQPVTAEFSEKIKKKPANCENCSKISGNYYEAVLQYRGEGDLDLDKDEVSAKKRSHPGVDYYIVSLRYARSIASKLRKKGYTTTEAYKIHGRKEGKNVFRTNISLRPPPFSAGDIIERDCEAYFVTRVGENTETYNLSKGRPTAVHPKSIGEFEKIGGHEMVHAAVVSAVTPKEIQVLELKSFKTHTLPKKQGDDFSHGDEIKVVMHKNKCLIIPKHLI